MSHQDPHGHYAALSVRPDAPGEEIDLAYRLLKLAHQERRGSVDIARARAAYAELGDPQRRANYDSLGQTRILAGASGRLRTPGVLMGLVAILALILIWTIAPAVRTGLTSFSPGDDLYQRGNGRWLGTVQRYEANHTFHNGSQAPAYLLEPSPGADGIWYPSRDLARIAQRR